MSNPYYHFPQVPGYVFHHFYAQHLLLGLRTQLMSHRDITVILPKPNAAKQLVPGVERVWEDGVRVGELGFSWREGVGSVNAAAADTATAVSRTPTP